MKGNNLILEECDDTDESQRWIYKVTFPSLLNSPNLQKLIRKYTQNHISLFSVILNVLILQHRNFIKKEKKHYSPELLSAQNTFPEKKAGNRSDGT